MEKQREKGDGGSQASQGPLSQPAHCLTYEEAIRDLNTHPDEGLTTPEATKRLEIYGPNMLEEGEGVSVVKILIRQVANAMMLVKRPIFYPLLRLIRIMQFV